jgi:hypothetical protein
MLFMFHFSKKKEMSKKTSPVSNKFYYQIIFYLVLGAVAFGFSAPLASSFFTVFAEVQLEAQRPDEQELLL